MMGRSKKLDGESEQGEVSLIPIMNLVCLLIPFLLYTASFVVFATVDVTASRNTPCVNCSEEQTPQLDLTVVITDQGFRVASGDDEALPTSCGAAEASTALHIPLSQSAGACTDDSGYPSGSDRAERQSLRLGPPSCAYNFDRLQQCMIDLKAEHPDDSRIIISGEPGTDYETLIRAMDATRGSPDQPLFPNVSIAAGLA